MAIIGILAGIGTPLILTWLPDIRLKSAARDVFSLMQNARMQAIKDNRDWAIVFDTVNNRLYLCSNQGADGTWTGAGDPTGTGDNTIVQRMDLTTYNSGIGFGHGAATVDATGGAWPNGDVSYVPTAVTFNSRGTGNAGFVYLDHQGNTTAYAVGTVSSGSIRIRRWMGAGPTPWQ